MVRTDPIPWVLNPSTLPIRDKILHKSYWFKVETMYKEQNPNPHGIISTVTPWLYLKETIPMHYQANSFWLI